MQTPEQNRGNCRHGVTPLARRLSLRIRCARPEPISGKDQKNLLDELNLEWIDALAESSAVYGEPSLTLRDQFLVNERSSLERGSAATRTVVRSISPVLGSDELTHISRINRR